MIDNASVCLCPQENNPGQHATLLKAHPDLTGYLPENYGQDFANLNVIKSVHMEVRSALHPTFCVVRDTNMGHHSAGGNSAAGVPNWNLGPRTSGACLPYVIENALPSPTITLCDPP